MGIAEFNRFLQEKIRELGVPELEAVPAAALLEQSGLLRDSQHRSDRDVRKDLFFNRPRMTRIGPRITRIDSRISRII